MQRATAARLLDQFAGRRALCVGDILYDSFVYGEVRRVSREAPVPILSEIRRSAMLGGAGNLARNVESLGGQAILVGVVGNDAEGDAVRALLTSSAPDSAAGVLTDVSRCTPSKIRYVANGQQMFCVDRDPEAPIGSDTQERVLDAVRSRIDGADVVILSDYGRGLVSGDFARSLIELARKSGVPVCVDPRGLDYTRYDGAYVIKPNADELSAETGLPVTDDQSAENALKTLKSRLPETDALLVTRGGQGMSLLAGNATVAHHRARPRSVFDVSGAGDTALAALSLGVAAGLTLPDCMALADLAAGTAVGKAGTASVTPEEVLQDAAGGEKAPDWRVITRDTAATLTDQWRREGLKIGFTNGCFDILHPGHLAVLRHAKSTCDRLIVGLNSDGSVKRLKGEDRPINDQASRALMLASLEMVDRVVVFEEDTPQALIEALTPHVLIKGADYTADELPGARHIKAHGGEVVLAPLVEGLSTTNLVNKLAGRR